MPTEEQDPFGEYAPASQTDAASPVSQKPSPVEVESEKYGIGKPHRIIVRGNVAADSGTKDKRK